MPRLNKSNSETIARKFMEHSRALAKKMGHAEFAPVHFIYALLYMPWLSPASVELTGNVRLTVQITDRVRAMYKSYYGSTSLPPLSQTLAMESVFKRIFLPLTIDSQNVDKPLAEKPKLISVDDIIVAVIDENDSNVTELLELVGIDPPKLRELLTQAVAT